MPEPDLKTGKLGEHYWPVKSLEDLGTLPGAMCIERGNNYGTVSSSLIALASLIRQKNHSGPVAIRLTPNRTEYKQIKF